MHLHYDRSRGEYGSLKTGNRKRDIPMPDVLAAALETIRGQSSFPGADDPVFSSCHGKPISANNVRKRWLVPLGTRLKLPGALGWHTFRHSHATLTKQLGLNDQDRMALTGHASTEMIGRYTHEDRRKTVEAIAAKIIGESNNSDQQLTSEIKQPLKAKLLRMPKVG